MKKNLDLDVCSIGDVFIVTWGYKIIVRLRKRYAGELPMFSDFLRLFVLHRLWPLEDMLATGRETAKRGRGKIARLCGVR